MQKILSWTDARIYTKQHSVMKNTKNNAHTLLLLKIFNKNNYNSINKLIITLINNKI